MLKGYTFYQICRTNDLPMKKSKIWVSLLLALSEQVALHFEKHVVDNLVNDRTHFETAERMLVSSLDTNQSGV